MKLRSIRLKDVRRFTDPVRIDGIGDGVNVLSAPNEHGKSTLFDALRALFFVPHGSRGKEIALLRPHAGGAPEVSVEIETADGRFVIAKRWFSRPEARVTRAGALVAQADAAEAWIAGVLGGGDGGPSGLLWVRQGLSGLTDGSARDQQAALEARRDLLSSVTGEVEAMTGGRRMDAALARCREELGAYATATGRPRAGGPWAGAVQDVDSLSTERDALADRVATLQSALDERSLLRRELADLTAPEAVATRQDRLAAAQAAFDTAKAHAATLETAEQALRHATEARDRARADLAALRQAVQDLAAATERDRQAIARLAEAEATLAGAETAHSNAVADHDAALARQQTAETRLRQVQAHAATAAAEARRADLSDRLNRALAARQAVETAKAEAAIGPDAAALDRLRRLEATLATARALRDSTATRVSIRYLPGAENRLRHGERVLDDAAVLPIHRDTTLDLPGIGSLTIHPGEGPEGLADVAAAEEALNLALEALDLGSIDAALQAHRARTEAGARLTGAQAELDAIAPAGIEDLQRQLAALPDAGAGSAAPDLPDPDAAEAELAAARATTADLAARRDAARDRRDTARTGRAEALALRGAAAERLDAAQTARDRLAAQDSDTLADAARTAEAAQATAEAELSRLRATAPDIAASEAALTRARSVAQAAGQRIDALRPAIAALDERIAGNAGDAVEERLREAEDRLAVAVDRLARIEREVKVLYRLQAALEDARSDARDRYFEPVAGELRPLLHLLWPEAELNWADATLLPRALVRGGQEETLDILSGGTQEQIALMVRLAFARLLARDGRHAPVILDDALVFTDDDRIERMFDALHRQAGDLQILVLSCRQRAFRDLGGTVLRIVSDPSAG